MVYIGNNTMKIVLFAWVRRLFSKWFPTKTKQTTKTALAASSGPRLYFDEDEEYVSLKAILENGHLLNFIKVNKKVLARDADEHTAILWE